MIDFDDLDFHQPFNRGAAMRALGLPEQAVSLEPESTAEWLKGWRWQDERGSQPVIWKRSEAL